MRATILLSIAALFSAASTWNILKDARPLTVDHNAQHTLQDLNPPTDNDQLLENSVTGTTLYEAVDTNGDISIFEKLPSPLEPEFYHQTSADTTKSHTHLSSTGPSDPALAARHTATEPALLDLQQDPIVKEKGDTVLGVKERKRSGRWRKRKRAGNLGLIGGRSSCSHIQGRYRKRCKRMGAGERELDGSSSESRVK
ncbi:uncharacterized protein PAC_11661 [Phialocephala subalpina]|uniref:Uncharacterized protein n=1 Tax=Phialocephala subalpina TaxID=576137 RepID=A0A1L7X9R8_9HELO|nr:uncharacterized protein PAC_11661 [Phialocephala subalpina]